MTSPTSTGQVGAPVGGRVRAVYAQLGPAERRVADVVLDHLAQLPGYSVAELAALSGVSKATVSRFFRTVGFDSFAQARSQARERGVPVGAVRGSDAVAAHLAHDVAALDRLAEGLDRSAVDDVVRSLAAARRVLVVGWRNSYPVALHLREQLVQARPDVAVGPQPGQTLAEEVAGLGHLDVLVVVGLRRRPPAVGRLLEVAAQRGIPVVLLGDPTTRDTERLVRHRIEVPLDGPGAFLSYAAATAVVTILAEGVLARLGRAARQRVGEVAAVHDALGELEGN